MSFSKKIHQSSGLIFPAVAVIMALALSTIMDPYLAFIATSWVIFGLLGLSLDIVWGRGGFLSLGQTAFYGLGGYFGSVVAINLAPITGNSLIWALPAGAIFGAIAAGLLGYIIFYARMGALQSTILSYTFTLLLWSVTQSFKMNIGEASISGDSGLSNIPGIILGFDPQAQTLNPNTSFAVVVIISAIIYFITRWLMRSHFGRIIDCIRIDHEKTELLGYDVRKFKLANFVFSGAVAGLAGALFALWSNFLNPSIFSVQEALLIPIYVLVGGLGTLAGPFVGALVIGALSFFLGTEAGGQTTLILGIILIILVLFFKNGLLGTLNALWQKYLPDPNEATRNSGAVQIDANVLQHILKDAEKQAGPAKSLVSTSLFKQFGGIIPVNKVSRNFQPGQPYSLIGPNGAGKSSFLKTCIGMYLPEEGHIYLGDVEISQMRIFDRVKNGMGVKNQKPQVFGELTVINNLWTAAFSQTRSNAKALEISHKILTMLGLSAHANVQASALSHGQQQWLDIGVVLCLAPRVVLLDEPAAGMTNEETRELSLLIRTLARHTTVVVVEHDMEFVRTLEGHVTVLHQGEVFAEGDIQTLRADDRVLDIYLGRRNHV
ncbi:ABC transporter permease subunit [Marinomonas transparens]|uniref:ATP-binding cassette domain-containing protein n=1 Tax=Marinomonas transparens TaxID=2795388 RepID=A0A934JIT2_9GAMM|nr:ATP-binding cassette domain-containing protein [Marinomonas transparens]MBJ7536835.1 ATP-binding cassette domain-containing protein [Marinomonas transparens]